MDGALRVDVSVDNGTTWVNEWEKMYNQGPGWNEAAIDLNTSYAGQIVRVRMRYTTTSVTNWSADCAIDHLRFMENPLGCMDSTACNYDSSATIDDSSCIFPRWLYKSNSF